MLKVYPKDNKAMAGFTASSPLVAIIGRGKSKARRFISFVRGPDEFRRYLCNRYPSLPPTSPWLWWLYPAWWKYQLYRWTCRFRTPDSRRERRRHRRYLVRVPSPAGIGDQIVTCWSETYLLAKEHGLTFVHYPFQQNPHSPEVDWEAFLDFSDGEAIAACVLSDPRLKKVYVPPMLLSSPQNKEIFARIIETVYSGSNIVFHLGTSIYLNSDIDQSEVMPGLYRQKYWRARSKEPVNLDYDKDLLQIALHIRRGDIRNLKETDSNQWANRWIDISYYLNLLSQLKAILHGVDVQLHVFSDGSRKELAEFEAFPDLAMHLAEDPRKAFHAMVIADILIVSTSAFSLCAGKISKGLKLAGCHFDKSDFRLYIPQSEDWVFTEPDGHLSSGSILCIKKRLNLPLS
jgi:hypothetical protein